MCFHISPGSDQQGYVKYRIRFPPSRKHEIPFYLFSMDNKFQSNRRAYRLLNTEHLYRPGIHHNFIFRLRLMALHRFAKSQLDTGIIHIIKFSMAFQKFLVLHAVAQNTIIRNFFDEFMAFDSFILLIRNIF